MSKAQRLVRMRSWTSPYLRVPCEYLRPWRPGTWMSRLHKSEVVMKVYMQCIYIYVYLCVRRWLCIYIYVCVCVLKKMCFLNYFIISLYLVMAWVCLLRCSGARHSTYKQVISKRPPQCWRNELASSSVPWRRSKCFAWWERLTKMTSPKLGMTAEWSSSKKGVWLPKQISCWHSTLQACWDRGKEREKETHQYWVYISVIFWFSGTSQKYKISLISADGHPGTQPCSFTLSGGRPRLACTSPEPHMCKWSELVFCTEKSYTEKKCSA